MLVLLPGIIRIHSFSSRRNTRPSSPRYEDDTRNYWEEEQPSPPPIRNDYQQDYPDYPDFYWETCSTPYGTAHIALPPVRPTCIIHFLGGTFFGSAPTVWYPLTELAHQTSAAIVATSIPLSLKPLDHVALAKQVSEQFTDACVQVLEDEYGRIDDLPICGIGHSLGARLLVVLNTLRPPTRYQGMCLISFTNYEAAAGIPGLAQLSRSSRRLENGSNPTGRERARSVRDYLDEMEYEEFYGDEDDESWEEIFDSIKESLGEQVDRVRRRLTPASKNLEFRPSPEQLWKALPDRYDVPHTLVVQFDDDEIDQSTQLANTIKNVTSTKFCRLRGSHLTPVSTADPDASSQATRLVSKILSSIRGSATEEAVKNMRRSIGRFVTDVVLKVETESLVD